MRITAIVFVSTQEKGSKRTKRNDLKRKVFVKERKGFGAKIKNKSAV